MVDRSELESKFKARILSVVDSNESTSLIEKLAIELADLVPDRAFEPLEPMDVGIIFLASDVDDDTVLDTQEKLLTAHLNLPKKHPINLIIHSHGGDVTSGLSLISTMHDIQRQGRVINTIVRGYAASMASVIFQAGNERIIDKFGALMLHELSWSPATDKLSQHEDGVISGKMLQDTLVSFYAARSGKPATYFKRRMQRRDWTVGAEEALSIGLVDTILDEPVYKPKRSKKSS